MIHAKIAPRALVVDDSPTQALEIRLRLVRAGVDVEIVTDGNSAVESLKKSLPDIVLTDMVMPGMNGLELVRYIKGRHPKIPVILLTAHGNEEIAAEALRLGAAGYVPKKNISRDLPRTLENVLAVARAHRNERLMLECLSWARLRFSLENDTSLVPALVQRLQQNLTRLNLCDETGLMRVSLALREALMNAIEHGNLEVSSQLREDDDTAYYDLVQQRRNLPPFQSRRVHVVSHESRDEVRYVIRDDGPGFDPKNLPDPTDPENMAKASGRGLLLIRSFMDDVQHNATGNEITIVKRREHCGH